MPEQDIGARHYFVEFIAGHNECIEDAMNRLTAQEESRGAEYVRTEQVQECLLLLFRRCGARAPDSECDQGSTG